MDETKVKKLFKDALKNEIAPLLIGLRNEIEKATSTQVQVLERVNTTLDTKEMSVVDFVEFLKGKPGYTPQKGVDYFTEDETKLFLQSVTPKKGHDYFTAVEATEFKDACTPRKGVDYFDGITPVKGTDYFTDEEATAFLKSITPIKGIHYRDGTDGAPGAKGADGTQITAEQIRTKLESLKGSARLSIKAIKGLEEKLAEHFKEYSGGKQSGQGGMGAGTGVTDSITGLITAGTNVTITGNGTIASPYRINSSGGGGGGTPGGSDTQLQYNNAGSFGGITGATTNGTFLTLTTPVLGVATATSINKIAITAPATGATLTIDDGLTLHVTGNVTALSGSHTGASSGTNTGDQTTSGTSNRITVSNGGTNPVIDISSSYVGQASITTLGTIATGTWNGTAVSGVYLDLSVGVSGGRTLTGGTASGNSLTLSSTSNATKGSIIFGASSYDEANNTLGIGTTASSTNKITFADTVLSGSGSLAGSLVNMTQTWNTSGAPTAIKLNVTNTASGAAALLMDLQIGGVSQFKVDKAGVGTFAGALSTGGAITTSFNVSGNSWLGSTLVRSGATSGFQWNGRSFMASPADGQITFSNSALTDFTRLNLGGTTSSFPSIKRNGTAINFRLADDSADADITLKGFTATGKGTFDATMTAGGTTGNQTINKPAGSVNIAAAGTTVTVTNSFVTASSIIHCVVMTNDTTALIKNVVPSSGSFVITMNAAVTAETKIGFIVYN